jgi:hypothetical protein
MSRLQRNSADYVEVRRIAERGRNHPVLMPNMNRYASVSGFPDCGAYREYIDGLGPFLMGAGKELLWRFRSSAERSATRRSMRSSPVGIRRIGLSSGSTTPQVSAASLCIEHAVTYRCPGNQPPFARKAAPRTLYAVSDAIAQALATIPPEECVNYLKGAGYASA